MGKTCPFKIQFIIYLNNQFPSENRDAREIYTTSRHKVDNFISFLYIIITVADIYISYFMLFNEFSTDKFCR